MDYQLILNTCEAVPAFTYTFTQPSHQMASAYARKVLEAMGQTSQWLRGAELFEANSGIHVATFNVKQMAKVTEVIDYSAPERLRLWL